MKVLFGGLLSALLVGMYCVSFAQVKPSVLQGKVLTDNNMVAESTTVILLRSADSSIVRSDLVSKTGTFEFANLKPDSYLVLASKIGYSKTYSEVYKLAESQSINIPNIVLKLVNNQLQEVKVVARRPYIEVKPGKIVLSIQNSILADGNSAYDILRQSPGVHVNSNETLSINGRQAALITIDGKPTNLTGDDLTNLLRSMQSNTIDQIEMISSASSKYDASGGGVINIILKKGKNYGTNGSINLMAGYGKYYKSTAGINFNSRTTKLNIFGNYSTDNNKGIRTITTNRNITYNDMLSNYNVDYNNIQISHNHNFKLGADYSITPKQTIGFLVSGIIREDNFAKHNNLYIYNQGQLDSVIKARSMLDRGSRYFNYNINYNVVLDKSGKSISADGNYATYNRHSNEFITNRFMTAENVKYRDSTQLENLSPSDIKIWTSKIDYTNPLSKTSRLEAGVKYNNAKSDNNLVFGPKEGNVYVADPTFSNRFVYTEIVSAAYINYINKIGKLDITAGVRAENTSSKGDSWSVSQKTASSNDSSYFNLFPQVQLSYELNKKNTLSVSYNRGIHRPAYEDINPFLYYTDLYDYRAGNPKLRPEYTTSIQISHTYNQTFTTDLYYNVTNDAYDFPVYQQNDSSKVNVTLRKNFGQIFIYGVSFYAPAQFTNWWSASFNLDALYVRYKAYAENGNFNKGKQDIIFNSTQTFKISPTITGEISGRYETPTIYGINELKASYSANAAISKQLFEKRGSIKLSLWDIFDTDRGRNHALYQNIDLTEVNKRDTRIVRLSFTYRFGKSTVKSANKRNTGNDDERRRTGN